MDEQRELDNIREAGWNAFHAGYLATDNPYTPQERGFATWLAGYWDAEEGLPF